MATKSAQQEPVKSEDIEDLLDTLDTSLDRVKVLYEQYFLGIQKQPPTFLHTDIERKIRELSQLQIRNTALRYRFATLQQKYGSYNSYWRRTLRQIENGTYIRNLHKIGREAARTGAAVPEEILAAMPKRMREQVKRDREAAVALARMREQAPSDEPELLTLADEDVDIDLGDLDPTAFIAESDELRRDVLTATRAHQVDESDADFDIDAFFAKVTSEGEPAERQLPISRSESAPGPGSPASSPAADWPAAGGRGDPRPPLLSRTRTDHPRPAATSGAPLEIGQLDAGRAGPAGPDSGHLGSGRAGAVQPAAERQRVPPRAPDPVEPMPAGAPPGVRPSPAPMIRTELPRGPVALPVTSAGVDARVPMVAPSQAARPVPIAPGASAAHAPAAVETLAGPFPRLPSLPPLPGPPRPGVARDAAGLAPAVDRPAGQRQVAVPSALRAPAAERPSVPSIEPAGESSRAAPPLRVPTPVPIPAPRVVPPARAPTPVPPSERPAMARVPTPPVAPPNAELPPVEPARARTPPPVRTPMPIPMPNPPAAAAAASPPPLDPAISDASVSERLPPQRSGSPRIPPVERRGPEPRPAAVPPGMSDADVNALYAKYVKAKQLLGEEAGPGAYGKLLKTLHAQAPKIMEQYNSRGVDFSVVVKDNQVIIRAKPKP